MALQLLVQAAAKWYFHSKTEDFAQAIDRGRDDGA
jgi:hypothetical protein